MQILQKQFEGHQLRVIERDSQPWFVLADVCAALDLNSPHKVAARLDEDERTQIPVTDSLGRGQDTTVINESGLYAVILRSDKPEARPFRKWITNEVLPSLRQSGTYTIGQPSPASPAALISARGVAAGLGCSPKAAMNRLSHAGIGPTHHFFEPLCQAAAYLFPLRHVQERWPAAVFAAHQGVSLPGLRPVVQAVSASATGKSVKKHRPRLIPTDTGTEQLARRLLSLEAQKREVLRELAALA